MNEKEQLERKAKANKDADPLVKEGEKQGDQPVVDPETAVAKGDPAVEAMAAGQVQETQGNEEMARLVKEDEEKKKAAEKKKEDEKKRIEAGKSAYRKALGDFLGGKLYDLIHKEVSPDKILEYGGKAVDGLWDAAGDWVGDIEKLDGKEKQALQKAMGALEKVVGEKVEEFLKSESGKNIAEKINHWLEANPWEVVGIMILAAAGAVAANVDIPELKQKFKIAEGLEAQLGAKLGKIRDISLQAINASLSFKKGKFSIKASGEYKDGAYKAGLEAGVEGEDWKLGATGEYTRDKEGEEGYKAGLEGSMGKGPNFLKGTGEVDNDGKLKIRLDGGLAKDWWKLTGHGEYGRNEEGDETKLLGANLRLGDEEFSLTSGLDYDLESGNLKLSLSQDIKDKLFSYHMGPIFEEGKDPTMEESFSLNNEKFTLSARTRFEEGGERELQEMSFDAKLSEKLSLTGGYGLSPEERSQLGLKYSTKDLDFKLSQSFGSEGLGELSGDFEKRFGEGFKLGGSATYDLADPKLLSLGGYFGFQDPDRFRGFLLDYQYKNQGDEPEHQFKARLEGELSKILFSVENEMRFGGEGLEYGSAELLTGTPINKDFMPLLGVKHDYGPVGGGKTWLEAGIQIKDVPLVISKDVSEGMGSGWMIGLRIPLGRRK